MGELLVEEKCMFCNRPVTEKTEQRLPDSRGGCEEIPTKLGAKVGVRLICKDCCSELVSMISGRLDS